jgi:hypothetical protein
MKRGGHKTRVFERYHVASDGNLRKRRGGHISGTVCWGEPLLPLPMVLRVVIAAPLDGRIDS